MTGMQIYLKRQPYDYTIIGLNERQSEVSWDSYVYYDSKQKRRIPKIRSLENRTMVFIGSSRTGKSHIAICKLKDELNKAEKKEEPNIRYIKARIIFAQVKAAFKEGYDPEISIISRLSNYKLLVIDEIDKGAQSIFERNLLFEIYDNRYNNRLPTIFIGNSSWEKMAFFLGTSFVNRLIDDAFFCKFTWESYQSSKHKENGQIWNVLTFF